MTVAIVTLSVIGFLLSLYSFYVEKKLEKSSNYKAICDISDRFSCTKAFKSGFGKTLGMNNSVFGLIFYVIVFVLALIGSINYVFYLSIISVIISLYLAYVLYFKVRSFCVVCNAIYIVNILLLLFSWSLF